jgi:hypothetical protein
VHISFLGQFQYSFLIFPDFVLCLPPAQDRGLPSCELIKYAYLSFSEETGGRDMARISRPLGEALTGKAHETLARFDFNDAYLSVPTLELAETTEANTTVQASGIWEWWSDSA